jgi:hypothetical protein
MKPRQLFPDHAGHRPARHRARFAWLLAGCAVVLGCGRAPQVGPGNYRLVESLRTAISARRVDWLDINAKLIAQRHKAGEMNDEQFDAFEAIIKKARDGNWEEAESDAIWLAKGQQPTTEDLGRSRAKKGPAIEP